MQKLILAELENDRWHDDVTSGLLGEEGARSARAVVVAKEDGVYSGARAIEAFHAVVSPRVVLASLVAEGDRFRAGDRIAELSGSVAAILGVERTLLNFLAHACGIATETRRYVDAVAGTGTRILATRKTLPGLRDLQLAAVRAGGGFVHRRSLADGILIKENHAARVPEGELLARAAKARSPLHGVEIEVQSAEALERVIACAGQNPHHPPTVVMLDNFGPDAVAAAVRRIGGRAAIEVSGGVTLERVRAIAECGVQYISVGRLTHSVRALDLSLDFAEGTA